MQKRYVILIKIIVSLVLAFLLILTMGFFAVKFGWTKVTGELDKNSDIYNKLAENKITNKQDDNNKNTLQTINQFESNLACQLPEIAKFAPLEARGILDIYQKFHNEDLVKNMVGAVVLRLNNQSLSQYISNCSMVDNLTLSNVNIVVNTKTSIFEWQNEESWQIIKEALGKDQATLNKAAQAAGVEPRLLVSVAIVEQLRLYHTQRELFETVFKPLKILANANKMAWGVMSIKEKMAQQTELNLINKNSDFYPGINYEHLLDFPENSEIDKLRYERLANEKNHYYSYLYGGLIIQEVLVQWNRYGYDLSKRPEIVATLFNLGFDKSKPKPDPKVGGSIIEINDHKYSFGALAYEFYYSQELSEMFPWQNNGK